MDERRTVLVAGAAGGVGEGIVRQLLLRNPDVLVVGTSRSEARLVALRERLGPVDFSASMGMPSLSGGLLIPDYPGDYFHYVFMKILMAGRANGLQVIDGPYVKVRDPDGFREYARRTQILGFDGKWSLHPDQVTILNEVFSPTQQQLDRAWEVLDAYREATEGERKGAVMLGDEMIDEASRKVAVTLVSRGERAGMTRSGS